MFILSVLFGGTIPSLSACNGLTGARGTGYGGNHTRGNRWQYVSLTRQLEKLKNYNQIIKKHNPPYKKIIVFYLVGVRQYLYITHQFLVSNKILYI